MQAYKRLLLANRSWVQEKLDLSKDYFARLAKDQQPDFLWIGCSDSRVPAEEVTVAQPGEIFVHRNIANQAPPHDMNANSVLHYAIEYLKVKHIIVCGHYGCGGIRAALSDQSFGYLDEWLGGIKKGWSNQMEELKNEADEERRMKIAVELNVEQQVKNLEQNPAVKHAWSQGATVVIHSWVYDIKTGRLNNLFIRGIKS